MKIGVGIGLSYPKYATFVNRGGQTSPFHPSLVDYWNFKGKSNSDKDRNVIKGIKGEILTAYNFGWSLGSGYGLFKENYLTYNKAQNVFVTDDHSITIMNFVPANTFAAFRYDTDHIKATKVRVTGLTATDQLTYEYSPSDGGSRAVFPISKDGEYDLPESISKSSGDPGYNVGFAVRGALTKNVTIEQIPEYEGAIVTDGVDDKLLGDGNLPILTDYTIIMRRKYLSGLQMPTSTPLATLGTFSSSDFVNYAFVFEDGRQEDLLSYQSVSYGDARKIVLVTDNDWTWQTKSKYRGATTFDNPSGRQLQGYLYVGGGLGGQTTPSKVAVWDIAIYSKSLTEEEIQGEINVMQYGVPNPAFALNFDNFAYKVTDYPEMFGTGKATANKIILESTQASFYGTIAAAMNPEADTGDPIEVPSYKVKVTGIDAYGNIGDDYWAIALMGMPIDTSQEPWVYLIYKDGVYNIPAISLSDRVFNLSVMCQITGVNKPIEIEVLYDSSITTNFPNVKQIFP